MLRIAVALVVATAVFLVAAAFSGTARYTEPDQVTTLSGQGKGILRLVP